MPTLALARKTVSAFKEHGVDANWHYYDNSWHYIRAWEHFVGQKTLGALPKEVQEGLAYLKTAKFEQSDDVIGRNISCLIKLSWSEEEVKERAEKMVTAIKSVL